MREFFLRSLSSVALIFAFGAQSAWATPQGPVRWLLHGPGVAAVAADVEASHLLDNTQPFIMRGRYVDAIPSDWKAISFASFTSFRAIKNALEGGRLDSNVKGVMYDNEHWKFTPEDEQEDPARFGKLAADLVHAHGLLFLAAPAVNLVAVLAPESASPGAHQRYDAYLRLKISADAARYADLVDIQAQGSERNTEVYANFVSQAAAQAREANPKVLVFAGVSTNPSGQQVNADDILRAIAATRGSVDGYWLNIPQSSEYCPRCGDFRPDIAVEVIRRLAR
jgi:hypothetical protein